MIFAAICLTCLILALISKDDQNSNKKRIKKKRKGEHYNFIFPNSVFINSQIGNVHEGENRELNSENLR